MISGICLLYHGGSPLMHNGLLLQISTNAIYQLDIGPSYSTEFHLLSRNRDLCLRRKSNSVTTLLIREIASSRMNSDTVVLVSTMISHQSSFELSNNFAYPNNHSARFVRCTNLIVGRLCDMIEQELEKVLRLLFFEPYDTAGEA